MDELLGGLSGKCKQHTALFFDQLPKGKLWAIESKKYLNNKINI